MVVDVSTRSMSVKLAFSHLWKHIIHWIALTFSVMVIVKESGSVVKEFAANESVGEKYLHDHIDQVEKLAVEEFCSIALVSALVFSKDFVQLVSNGLLTLDRQFSPKKRMMMIF